MTDIPTARPSAKSESRQAAGEVEPDSVKGSDRPSRVRAWLGLAVLILIGVGVRLAYLHWAVAQPGFAWSDPDYYLANAYRLVEGGHWHWSLEAIEYPYLGRVFHLPPLYSLYLSCFGLTPWPWAAAAALGHTLLSGVGVVAVYAVGANLHSRRAGLIAGALMVLSPAGLTASPIFVQEQLYIPLLLAAFAVLTWLLAGRRGAVWWAVGGVAFGLAILTRSMPIYYLPFAAAGIVWLAPDRLRAKHQIAWLLAGAAAVTLAYSVWLSAQVGRWIFVEDHASISMTAYTGIIRTAPPSLLDESLALVSAFVEKPGPSLETLAEVVRSNFRPTARRWVGLYFPSVTGIPQVLLSVYARVMTDVGFVLAVLLAPFGVALARQRRASLVLAIWPPLVVLLTALSTYGGPRYRGPFEVVLYLYLSVVLAGRWRTPSRRAVLAAATVCAGSWWLVV